MDRLKNTIRKKVKVQVSRTGSKTSEKGPKGEKIKAGGGGFRNWQSVKYGFRNTSNGKAN